MPNSSGLKFAVVREDPEVELEVIRRFVLTRPLLVVSGGCTLLTLKSKFPEMEVTAFDTNPAQIDHTRSKAMAVAAGELDRLNVGQIDPRGLNQNGAFEDLFRVLRSSLVNLVTGEVDLLSYFDLGENERAKMIRNWTSNPFWLPSFHGAFNDPLLHAMFGPAATQHAPKGSYPGYFADVFARGLSATDAHRNPFLQHVLLGMYRSEDAPSYVHGTTLDGVRILEGGLLQVPDLETHDLVQLSNIFDWSDDTLVQQWAQYLKRLRPGAVVLMRQLNNTRNLRPHFEPEFAFDAALGESLRAQDRSLFYNRIEVGVRQ